MGKLLRFLKDYWKESVLSPLFKLFEAILELFVPLTVASLIDVGIGMKNREHTVQLFFFLILLGLIGLLFSVTAQYFAAKAAVGFVKTIREELFAHLQTLSYHEIDQLGTANMITRMISDVNQVQTGVNLTLRLLLRSPFVVAGAFIMAWQIDHQVAKTMGITILLLTVFVFSLMFLAIPLYRKVQQKLDRILCATRENLIGVRVIRAFGMEDTEISKFQQKQGELLREQLGSARVMALLNPFSYILINLGIVLMVYQGAIGVENGILTQGAVVALYQYMAQILEELIKLANMIINLTKAVASGNRIQEMFTWESSQNFLPKTREELKQGNSHVVFDQVSFSYSEGGEEVLTSLSFCVNRGMTVGIIGGTGSGKTSLVNLIPRFYDASSGKILIDGIEVKNYSKKALRELIAVVPQKSTLIKGTIRENLCWGNERAKDEELWLALKMAKVDEVVENKSGKLDFIVEQKARNLSGGQRQRLAIARALVKKSPILILDDSFSALDYETEGAIRKALQNGEDKPTLFIVSQRTISIQHADLILVLDEGKLVGKGTHQELLDKCEVYREIHRSQGNREKESVSMKR